MSAKNSSPMSSPKHQKSVRVDAPSTPPSARNRKRLSAGLSTPDPSNEVPFSPGMKRSSSGQLRSPDPRQADAMSPCSVNNLLKTPGNPDYDSDGGEGSRRSKLMKTPQYFSPGKRLFNDDSSPNKKELGEISSQLKNRLSSAFGSLQQKEKTGSGISPVKLDFTSGAYASGKESPTRISSAPSQAERTPSTALNRANINLQTLQASPRIDSGSGNGTFDSPSRHSPSLAGDHPQFQQYQQQVSMPSPDEESSAHNALMMALSRAKERRKSQNNDYRRPSFSSGFNDQMNPQSHRPHTLGSMPQKLPPINVRSPPRSEGVSEGVSEQEAVYSLMSLSSPQANKHDFSSLQAAAQMQANGYKDSSRESSRASSIAMPVLPPVTGLLQKYDDDETDIESVSASDSDETS